jgi:hypothetical protein
MIKVYHDDSALKIPVEALSPIFGMSFLSAFSRASICFSRMLEAVSLEEREEHPCFSLYRVSRAR